MPLLLVTDALGFRNVSRHRGKLFAPSMVVAFLSYFLLAAFLPSDGHALLALAVVCLVCLEAQPTALNAEQG